MFHITVTYYWAMASKIISTLRTLGIGHDSTGYSNWQQIKHQIPALMAPLCDRDPPVTARWLLDYPHHDDVIKWKHFPLYWPFVWGIHRSPVNSPHKGQRRGALMFSFICAKINGWVNNREARDLRRHGAHDNIIVMKQGLLMWTALPCLDVIMTLLLSSGVKHQGIILGMGSANEKRRYNVASLIGWVHTQNNNWITRKI